MKALSPDSFRVINVCNMTDKLESFNPELKMKRKVTDVCFQLVCPNSNRKLDSQNSLSLVNL